MSRPVFLLAIVVSLGPPVRADDRPVVTLVTPREGPAYVEVRGLPRDTLDRLRAAKADDWRAVVRVVVAGGTPEEIRSREPVAGTYQPTESGVRFEPLFPFLPGREYVVEVVAGPGVPPLRTTIRLPQPPPGPRVAVTAVYPSDDVVPENMLRWYLHFSGPVGRGDVYRHLKLLRDDGREVESPFLELPEELWSPDGLRLTVLFHPGRVKRGLLPREQEGPILQEGRTYTLIVSGAWADAAGRPLRTEYRKTFRVGPPKDRPVDPGEWVLCPPAAGSEEALVVRLPEPLDHALLGRLLTVADAAGRAVPGQVTVGGGERVVAFAPSRPWTPGEYRLLIDTRLEDVCGNRVGEPFEGDEFGPVTPRIEARTVERRFVVR